VLLCAALVFQSTQIGTAGRDIGALTDPGLLLRNALLIQNYSPGSVNTGIGAMWSLAVELVFYAALPALVIVALRLGQGRTRSGRRWALLAPAAIMAFVGLASVGLGPHNADSGASWDRVWDVSIFTHAHLFAFGLALAVARAEWQDGLLRLPRWWRPATAGALLFLAAGATLLGARGAIPERIEVALIAVAIGLLLALTVLSPGASDSRLVAGLERRALVGAGVISYSIFLWHVPVIYFLRKHGLTLGGDAGALGVNLLAVSAITAALAWLTWHFVERPALRRKASSHIRDGAQTARQGIGVPEPVRR
jgi:peptidoglycan/LPS O-acetylase OafA/YrhL